MSSANLTMIGMYNYDGTLFDGLTFPAGINKDTAIDEILLKCGEFEVVYSDITFMKSAIEHWGKKNYRTFDKWVQALAIEFDPLYNYDRFEEYTDAKVTAGSSRNSVTNETTGASVSSAGSKSETEGKKSDQSMSQTSTGTDGSSGTQRDVSAYDSATYEPREKETGTSSSTADGNGIAMSTGKESGESKDLTNSTNMTSGKGSQVGSETTSGTEQTKHTAHLYGNIGVTTSTQMLEDFLRVERFNIYEQLADMFVLEFVIPVY